MIQARCFGFRIRVPALNLPVEGLARYDCAISVGNMVSVPAVALENIF